MTTKVEKVNKISKVEGPKKKKKFKIPGAIAILAGVLVVAIFITWIVHFVTTGIYLDKDTILVIDSVSLAFTEDSNGIVTITDYATFSVTNYEGGNNWYINEGANVLLNGQWVTLDVNIVEYAAGQLWDGVINIPLSVVDGDAASDLIDQLNSVNVTNIIANAWFNFSDSNWYVSDNGMYGIGDIIKATIAGMFSAADLIFFTIGIGVMIEILMETQVLKGLVNSMIKGLNNKRILLAPALFIVFSLWGTMLGTQEATLALMPIIVPALIIAGFDAMTGFLIILVGVTTGIAASILEPFALSTLAAEFSNKWDELVINGGMENNTGVTVVGIGTGIGLRSVLWVVYTTMGCLFVSWYGNRVLKSPEKSFEDSEMRASNQIWAKKSFGEEEHESMSKKQKWALVILVGTISWMIFCLLPWSTWLGQEAVNGNLWQTVSHFFFYSTEFGGWTFLQLGFTFMFGWLICAKMFGYSKEQMKNNWKAAWNTFKGIALILTLSRATSIVLSNSGNASYLSTTIFSTISEGLSGGQMALTVFPIYVVMALFIPSMSGLAAISAPIISSLFDGMPDASTILIAMTGILALYPLAQGLVNMISPTTGLCVAQAEASNTSFGKALPLLAVYGASIAAAGLIIVSLDLFILMPSMHAL